jgi:hypothetical protein
MEQKKKDNCNWILFLEDPGALNFMYSIIDPIYNIGVCLKIIADGYAIDFLKEKKISFTLTSQLNLTEYFTTNTISLLITGTSENRNSFSFKLTDTARSAGIPVVAFVDGPGSSKERFKGLSFNSLQWAPDWLIVPDNWVAALYENIGFRKDRIKIVGHPHYDFVFSLRKKWSEESKNEQRDRLLPEAGVRKVLLFISEISTGLNHDFYRRSSDYTLKGDLTSDGRTEIVLDELLISVKEMKNKPYMVLRLHPKQTSKELTKYLTQFDYISQHEPALEIVNASDIIVGMTSSLLLESFYLGKQTISIVPNPKEKMYLGNIAEFIGCFSTRNEIHDNLITIGDQSQEYNSDYENDYEKDGQSLKKIMDFFESTFILL